MELSEFISRLETILPPETAMQGDRFGLQLQCGRQGISKVLVTMEVTDAVVEEAVRQSCDCILSFHPLIFAPLTSITETERVGRLCSELIRRNIALIVAHTTFDSFPKGTNFILSQKLDLQVERPLIPDKSVAGFGMGILAKSEFPINLNELVARVSEVCNSPVRFCDGSGKPIQRIAIVGGSGGSFIGDALSAGADVFITADIRYHDFHRVRGIMALIDPGHYEMEQFVATGLAEVIKKFVRFDETLEIIESSILPNPARYFPNTELYYLSQQNFLTHNLS